MNTMVIFLIAFILVGILPILNKAKGASMFMMLCVGKMLVDAAGSEVSLAARMVLNSSLPVDDIAKMFLMLVPPVLTLFITKKTAKKRFLFHIIPSICGGLLAGLWSVDYFTAADPFKSSTTYTYAQTNSVMILLLGITTTLILFFVERPKPVKPEDQPGHGK